MPIRAASIQFFIKFMTASIVQFKSTLTFISPISGISFKLSDARERIVKTSVGFLSNASVPASTRDNNNNASSKCVSLIICRSISAARVSPKFFFAIWTVKEIDVIGVLS